MITTQIPRLKFSEKLGFGSFSMATNIVYQFRSLYYLFFLTNVLKIHVLTAGTIFAIGTVWDAVNDPMVGFYAVNHKFRSGEHVRPFALWYALPWAVTVVLMFTNFHLSYALTVSVALLIYLIFELFYTCVSIPYNSMGGLATNHDSDRRSINVFRNLGGCVGTAVGAVACLPLLKVFGAMDAGGNLIDKASSRGFLLAACVMGVICLIGCYIHYFTTKERVKPLVETEEKVSIKAAARMLIRNHSFIMNTLYVICYGIINLLVMTCLVYYATYVMGSTAEATTIQVFYLVAAVLFSFFVTPIDKKLGRKKTMMLGGILYVVGKVWFVIDPFSVGAIYVNAISMGIAVTITFVMFNTNRNNLADLIEWKEGRRLDGLVATADNLAAKLGDALATELMAVALHLTGYNVDLPVQPQAAINAINAMLGWIPMLFGVAVIVIVWFHDIEKEVNKMNEEKALSAR